MPTSYRSFKAQIEPFCFTSLPSTNEVWGKVMFYTYLSFCFYTYLSFCSRGGGAPASRVVCIKGGSAYMARVCLGGSASGDGQIPQCLQWGGGGGVRDRGSWADPTELGKRTVRILLECCLVFLFFFW